MQGLPFDAVAFAVERFVDAAGDAVAEVFGVVEVGEASGGDFDVAFYLAGLVVDGDDDDDDAVGGEVLAVAEDGVVDAADVESVNVDIRGGGFADDAGFRLG